MLHPTYPGRPFNNAPSPPPLSCPQLIKHLVQLKEAVARLAAVEQAACELEQPFLCALEGSGHASSGGKAGGEAKAGAAAGSSDDAEADAEAARFGAGQLASVPVHAWRGLSVATALRRLALNYMHANEPLTKALNALQPLLQQHRLQGRGAPVGGLEAFPEWLQQPAGRASLAAAEPGALQVVEDLQRLESRLECTELQMLQGHLWRSLSPASSSPAGAAGAAAGQTPSKGRGKDKAGSSGTSSAQGGPALCGLQGLLAPGASCLREAAPGAKSSAAQAAAEGGALWRVLMADWAMSAAGQPGVRGAELLPLAQQVYAQAGLQAPAAGSTPPAREANPLAGAMAALQGSGSGAGAGSGGAAGAELMVGVRGPPLDAARWAVVGGAAGKGAEEEEQEAVVVPRCGASLLVCGSRAAWHCAACKRR